MDIANARSTISTVAFRMLFSNGTSAVLEAEDRLHAHVRGQFMALRRNTTLVGTALDSQSEDAAADHATPR